MAQGINGRTRLTMPQTFTRGEQDAAKMQVESNKKLMSWANALPFGSAGFHIGRDSNDVSVANGADGTITWNRLVYDRENWYQPGIQNIVVPRGLSGIYAISYSLFLGGTFAGAFPWVKVNGNGISNNPGGGGVTWRIYQGVTLTQLEEGQTITAGFTNATGGAVSATYTAAATNSASLPELRAWRISLL